jgi:predicted neuraminidase
MKLISTLIALFILTSFLPSSGLAQITNDPWAEPVNLSHSGAATDPTMVVDAQGTFHIIWLDRFNGPTYTEGDGENWEPPVLVRLPFGSLDESSLTSILFKPLLIPDSAGNIHAFWRNADSKLIYSHVPASGFAASQWSESTILDDSAVDLNVAIDAQDRLYLSYVRKNDTTELPAGIYYRQSSDLGNTWSAPTLLYQSAYFRALSEQDAHVQIATASAADGQSVYVVWDNRPRGQVFLIESSDGGNSWSEPEEVGIAGESAGGAIRSNLAVYARGEKVLLLWQTGQPETGCTQNYQWSLDGSATWQPRQSISAGSLGCPQEIQIMDGNDGPIFLATSSQGNFSQVFLLAWDGTQWSDPQVQRPLSSFIDPETGQTVDFDHRQAHLDSGLDLFVLGTGRSEQGDIWWLRRSMTDVGTWFPQELVWSPLTPVTIGTSRFLSLALVAGADNLVHVFWTQTKDADLGKPDTAIYYTRWEAERLWSQPVAILVSPDEVADQPAAALDAAGDLLLVWRRGQEGQIAFSRASADQAVLPEDWSDPQILSDSQRPATSPAILADREGSIYVVYAVPINEGRGIYLTRSQDGGGTWSEPVLAFDGTAAGWDMLDQPHFTVTDNGDLYLLWTRYSLLSGQPAPMTLAFSHSEDGGRTWTQHETAGENPVVWSAITSVGDRSVHRFWQELVNGRLTLWHERSVDNGRTWVRIAPVSVFGETQGMPNLVRDAAGNLHLLQVVDRGQGNLVLQHWRWDGARWGGQPSLNLGVDSNTSIDGLMAGVSPQGDLTAVFSCSVVPSDLTEQQQYELLFTKRSLDLTGTVPTPLPPPIPTAAETRTPTQAIGVVPTPTPTVDIAALASGTTGAGQGNRWGGVVMGALLAGLIVLMAFGFGIWRSRGSP